MSTIPANLAGRLQELERLTPAMVDALGDLVSAESPSSDVAATAACAERVASLGTALLGTPPERVELAGCVHLRWQFGSTRAMVIGHFDTVWPTGTLERWPFAVADGRATGPGVFDMKAGVVQALYGLSLLDDLEGVGILLTSDEELGSLTSRPLIEAMAAGARGALVAEPSSDGALKLARKGVSMYTLDLAGRAAHASAPERGANALVELARLLDRATTFANPGLGTTVTPTVATAGSAGNTVPAHAHAYIDVRATTVVEQERVDEAMRSLAPSDPAVSLVLAGGANRAPMERSASAGLFEVARRLAASMGLPGLSGRDVAGGSDGNFTAALGIPTLDGLGAVGDHPHAEGEYVVVEAMPQRAALVAALADELRAPLS